MPDRTMKAVQQHEFGGPEVLHLEEAPMPELKPGGVLVRVYAVGINPPDWYLRDGYKMLPPEWQPKLEFPVILGTDISGIIEAVGEGVENFAAGDEVYSMVRFPSGLAGQSRAYAEYVTVPASEVALKPAKLDHTHAAADPMSLYNAWQLFVEKGHSEKNPLQPTQHEPVPLEGKKVLINGAAGGVGLFALQLAKWKGAHVIAVASGKHEALLCELGADEFIDYTKIKTEEVLRDVDLVLDTVGGPETGRFLQTLKTGGHLFPVFPLGFNGAENAKKQGITVSATQVQSNGPQLAKIAGLLDAGVLRVVLDSTYPLAEANKAHERAAQGHVQGKLVLTLA